MVGQDAHIDFIGRESEVALYLEWLNRSDDLWILYIHDTLNGLDKHALCNFVADSSDPHRPTKYW